MLGPVHKIDWVWDSATERRRKPQWHALIPPTRLHRERLFDLAGSQEFDIVRKAQEFTQVELEDYYVDVVERQVEEQLGHPLRTKDSIFLRFATALELETAAGNIPYRLTFTRCLRLYKAHDGSKQQDCEDIARDAWSRVGWRTPFSHRPRQKKRKTDWDLFERCRDHRHPGSSAEAIHYCVDCRDNQALYMKNPEESRRMALSKARAAREDDLMEEGSFSERDEDEDAYDPMLRQREDADMYNEEYSQPELESYMMSEEVQVPGVEPRRLKRVSSDEDDADDEDENEDVLGDMLVVPAKQQIQPTARGKTSSRHAHHTMNISSMIQQELVDDCSDEEVKRRRRERRKRKDAEDAMLKDRMLLLPDHEQMRILMEAANKTLNSWRRKGRGKRIEQTRKRKAEEMQELVEKGLAPAMPAPKRVRWAVSRQIFRY